MPPSPAATSTAVSTWSWSSPNRRSKTTARLASESRTNPRRSMPRTLNGTASWGVTSTIILDPVFVSSFSAVVGDARRPFTIQLRQSIHPPHNPLQKQRPGHDPQQPTHLPLGKRLVGRPFKELHFRAADE